VCSELAKRGHHGQEADGRACFPFGTRGVNRFTDR
jgi:hypothetical protein